MSNTTAPIIRLLYYLYERQLLHQVREGPLPGHVGIILDGNRRYARQHGLTDPQEIYRLGAQKLDDVLDWCEELRIPALTLWLFSTENLNRSPQEVSGVLAAIEEKLKMLAHALTQKEIGRYLYAADLPDPDLIIRTSGEIRLSGFLLWQSAYSEFYFSDVYWPAFRKIDFLRAVRAFQQRQRRFGR